MNVTVYRWKEESQEVEKGRVRKKKVTTSRVRRKEEAVYHRSFYRGIEIDDDYRGNCIVHEKPLPHRFGDTPSWGEPKAGDEEISLEFAEDELVALRDAINQYLGRKVGLKFVTRVVDA